MKTKVSFLIGSGFSIPEGIRSVTQINERLKAINENEILIHTDQHAFFLNGQSDPNRWSRQDERLFVQEFLKFYNNQVLKPGENFHYETFYDFYSGYLARQENSGIIENFCDSFNEKFIKNEIYKTRASQRISDFNRTFNQLLKSLLSKAKYFEDVSYLDYPPYDEFIKFLKLLLEKYELKIHSLNHDLFFDWLGRHHADLWQYYSDGFELGGSPFYGSVSYTFNDREGRPLVNKSYFVKLERFTGNFNKELCLFKLHGSISNTKVFPKDQSLGMVRLRHNYGVYQFYEEVENKMEHLWDEVNPDFISGTTNKTRYYSQDPYYRNLFNLFEKNLESSDLLIVIGYGFRDPGINDILKKKYMFNNRQIVIIDPVSEIPFINDYPNCKHINKSIIDVTLSELNQLAGLIK